MKALTIQGDKKLVKELRKLSQRVSGKDLESAVLAGAEPIRRAASEKAPRRTGKLAANIIIETVEKKKAFVIVGIGPHKDVWYGIFAEVGTSQHPAQPFLRPAIDEQKDNVLKVVGSELKKSLLRGVRA